MSLKFHSLPSPFLEVVIWGARADPYGFVISKGDDGYRASYKPLGSTDRAYHLDGGPFASFEEAQAACEAMHNTLLHPN